MLFVTPTVTFAAAGEKRGSITIDGTRDRYEVWRQMDLLEDRSRRFDIEQILKDETAEHHRLRWVRSGSSVPSFGFCSSVFWARIKFKAHRAAAAHWNLLFDYPHIDHITLYRVRDGAVIEMRHAGDRIAFNAREVKYRNFVFPRIWISGGDETIYLRVETESTVTFPVLLFSETGLANMMSVELFLLGIYYGIIAIIIIHSLFIFISTRDASYGYYVIWIAAFGMYQLTLNGFSYQYLWPDSVSWANTCLPLFIFVAAGAGTQFSRVFLHAAEGSRLVNRALIAVTAACVIGALLSLFLPYAIAIRIGTIGSIIVTVTLFGVGIYAWLKGFRPARFYVAAFSLILVGIALYAFKTIGLLPENALTNWAQQVGSIFQVSLLALALADRINIINDEKNAAMEERMKAQEKFRLLFDGSQNIIFTLDQEWRFTSVNQAIEEHLHIPAWQVTGKNFMDLLFVADNADEMTREFIRSRMEKMARERKPVSFRVPFATFYSQEYREVEVRLEYVSRGGKEEILGIASTVDDDLLLPFFVSERQIFRIGNYFSAAEDVSHHLTKYLSRYMDAKRAKLVRVAIREMIINAIEHGNLCITYEEKSRALAENRYFEFLAERQRDLRYRDRSVEIIYALGPERVAYRITDEGEGFDYEAYLTDASAIENSLNETHGRGIILARSVFDEVRYNRKGNQVLLVINFNTMDNHGLHAPSTPAEEGDAAGRQRVP